MLAYDSKTDDHCMWGRLQARGSGSGIDRAHGTVHGQVTRPVSVCPGMVLGGGGVVHLCPVRVPAGEGG